MSEEKDPKGQVIKEIIATAKDDPDVQAAGRNLAKAAKTVTEFINIALLPLSAANWGVERAKDYFTGKFESEFERYVADIPLESIKAPPGEIAGPALQGIAWSLDHEVLKDMFMRLLASAMDSRKDVSHPAFVRVIQQLSANEAEALNELFKSFLQGGVLPIVRLRITALDEQGFKEPMKHLAQHVNEEGSPEKNEHFPFWLDNWERLGIVEVRYGMFVEPRDKNYAWVTERPEYKEIEKALRIRERLEYEEGLVELSAFGEKLVEALT